MKRALPALAFLGLLAAGRQQLTKNDVVKLAQAGMPDDVIIAKIDQDKPAFPLSADDILQLKSDGVGEKVIRRMIACAPKGAQAVKPAPITKEQVVKLAKGGISDDTILAKLDEDDPKFVLSSDDMLALKKDGVSDKVIHRLVAGKQASPGKRVRPPRPLEMRPIVGVVEFADKSGFRDGTFGAEASSTLVTHLLDSAHVRVVEPFQIGKVLDELKLREAGVGDPAGAIQVGNAANCKYVIYGMIASVGVRAQKAGGTKEYVAAAEVEARIVDVSSGEVLFARKCEGQAKLEAPNPGGAAFDPALPRKAVAAAAAMMVEDILDKLE